jgi:hypothetical protein
MEPRLLLLGLTTVATIAALAAAVLTASPFLYALAGIALVSNVIVLRRPGA